MSALGQEPGHLGAAEPQLSLQKVGSRSLHLFPKAWTCVPLPTRRGTHCEALGLILMKIKLTLRLLSWETQKMRDAEISGHTASTKDCGRVPSSRADRKKALVS